MAVTKTIGPDGRPVYSRAQPDTKPAQEQPKAANNRPVTSSIGADGRTVYSRNPNYKKPDYSVKQPPSTQGAAAVSSGNTLGRKTTGEKLDSLFAGEHLGGGAETAKPVTEMDKWLNIGGSAVSGLERGIRGLAAVGDKLTLGGAVRGAAEGVAELTGNEALSNILDALPNPRRDFAEGQSGLSRRSQEVRTQTDNPILGAAADIAGAVGGMLPGIAASVAGGPAAGLAVMGASAGGNAYTEARKEGKGEIASTLYGGAVGASEAFLQKLLGGISAFGKSGVSKLFGDKIDDVIRAVAKNPGVQKTIQYIMGMGSEGAEEYLQSVLEPQVRNVIFGENNELGLTDPDKLYDGLVGALTGGVFELPGYVKSMRGQQNTGQSAQATTPTNTQAGQQADVGRSNLPRLSMEDFQNPNSPVWTSVDYNDAKTKAEITQKVASEMLEAGQFVELTEADLSKFAESFPDLRGMKKKDRTPILRQAVAKAKNYLRGMLERDFKGRPIEFEVNGNILEATLYDTGIKEVLEKLTQTKSAMLDKSGEIFAKSKYLYSTMDKASDGNILRWNYFYVPLSIGNETVGVRIAIRDMLKPSESQIYNWGIKKEATLPNDLAEQSSVRVDGTSVASLDPSVAETTPEVNNSIPAAPENNSPFGPNTVGAAESNPRSFSHLQNEHGVLEPGENPARAVDIPKKDADGRKVNRATRTIAEAGAIPDSFVEAMEPGIIEGMFSHDVATDKTANAYAMRTIEKQGYDGALSQWDAAVRSDGVVSKNDLALGQRLLVEAAHAEDYQTAMKLAAEISAEATRAGQTVQAMRLLKKMTPEGQLYYLRKVADNLTRDFQGHKGFSGEITLDPGMVETLLNAKTQEQMDAAAGAIQQNIANQTPVTWYDKWNAWRYLAMLGNPRTQVRNVVGNAIFMPVVKVKNLVGWQLENLVKRAGYLPEATKAVLNPQNAADRALVNFADGDFANMADTIQGGGKMNPQSEIMSKRRIFKSNFLEGYRKLTDWAMDKGDEVFSRQHYRSSLAQYMKANGLTAEYLTSGSKEANAALERARTYAVREAQRATFRDANAVASALNAAKRKVSRNFETAETTKGKIGWGIATAVTEGLVPFTKTPANILVRGVEYSPAGLVKGTYDTFKAVHDGKMIPSEALDTLSAGLTGTGIMLLGAWLASMGFVTGVGDEDDKRRSFDKMQGAQEYALNIGEYTYTIDWAAPAALPFFVGVAMADDRRRDEGYTISQLLDDMSAISEPMLEMSMLQGINNSFESVRYSPDTAISSVLGNLVTGYLGQANPTILGQISRSVDDTSRQTYYDPNYSGAVKEGSAFLQKQAAKIPGLSMTLQPRVDQWGREQENTGGSFLGRLAYNMLSPGYLDKRESTPVDKELEKLYEATGDSGLLPGYAPKSFTYGGERVKMSGDEYTQYAKTQGQTAYSTLEDIFSSRGYARATEEQKTDMVDAAHSYAAYMAKKELLGSEYNPKDRYAKIDKALKEARIDAAASILYFSMADKDGSGSISQDEAKRYLDSSGLTSTQKSYLFALTNSGWKSNPYK